MELNRRIGSGRLAEIFGEVALEADRLSRRLGIHRAAIAEVPRLPEHSERILGAYARGINTYIDRYKNKLPLEFTLLRTVCMGATLPNQPETVITVPSYLQIVNMADLSASLSGHSPGQSGHPGSKHYDDFIKPWLKVEHHPMLFERDEIEAHAEGMLYMQPK